jgi:hypothetical protein
MRIERAIDVIVFAGLTGVMINTPNVPLRMAAVVACSMLVLGWFVAWRRRT